MRKFSALITNEHVKLTGKLSTKLLLALLLICAFGFIYLLSLTVEGNLRGSVTFGGLNTPQERIRRAEAAQWEGWEQYVARIQYTIDHGIEYFPLFYTETQAYEIRERAWRTNAVYSLFNAKQTLQLAADAGASWAQTPPCYMIEQMDTAIRADNRLAFAAAYLAWLEQGYVFPHDMVHIEIWSLRQILYHNADFGTWQERVIHEMTMAKTNPSPATADRITLGEYRLTHGISHHTTRGMELQAFHSGTTDDMPGFWVGFSASLNILSVVSLALLIIAGGIVAGESSAGTIKFLLINPVSRWKILTAKYLTVLDAAVIMLVLMFAANFIASGLFFGFSGLTAPMLSVADGEVVRGSALWYMASRYLLSAVGTVVLATFAFMLSALARSSALAIGLSVFLYFAGWTIVVILSDLGFYQARYILFANTNIINVTNRMTGFVNHTLTFAVVNIAVHMVVFLFTAWDAWTRTNVK